MRIVGGEFRGHSLISPEGSDAVRPTSERTREAIFNILMHRYFGSLDGVRVADLYAGTGALGLEALSRGATQVTFVERARPALEALKANITAFKVQSKCRIVTGDAVVLPSSAPGQECGLVFLDPPYDKTVIVNTMASLRDQHWLAEGAILVCETRFNTDLTAPAGFVLHDARRYGKAKVTVMEYTGEDAIQASAVQ
jgi:16S rRNA (guanine966-N2)-methyltransferase